MAPTHLPTTTCWHACSDCAWSSTRNTSLFITVPINLLDVITQFSPVAKSQNENLTWSETQIIFWNCRSKIGHIQLKKLRHQEKLFHWPAMMRTGSHQAFDWFYSDYYNFCSSFEFPKELLVPLFHKKLKCLKILVYQVYFLLQLLYSELQNLDWARNLNDVLYS